MSAINVIRKPSIPVWRTKRYHVAFLFFIGNILQASLKFNLSIAIVCMVNHNKNSTLVDTSRAINYTTQLTLSDRCADHIYSNISSLQNQEGEFEWSKPLQGVLLGGLFWGFTGGQIAWGLLCQRYGARTVIGLGVGGAGLMTLFNPLTARVHPFLFMAVRVLTGLCVAAVFPSIVTLWSHWAPPSEYSRMTGLSLSGSAIGNALVFPLGGLLCGNDAQTGWETIFYVTGGCTVAWSLLWLLVVRDSPGKTPGISREEKEFLEQCALDRKGGSSGKHKVRSLPLSAMFKSVPVIALFVSHTLGNYCHYMFFTQMPTFFREILKVDMKSNGLYSMLPVLTLALLINCSGQIADRLISHNILTKSRTRKFLNTIGSVLPATFMIALGYLDCADKTLAIVLLCLAVGFMGFTFSGHVINYGDIALPYAGTLSGIGNTFSSMSGVIAPYVVAALTPNGTQTEWRTAFYVGATMYVLSATVFALFGSGVIQPWASHVMDQDANGTQTEWRTAFYVGATMYVLSATVFALFGSGVIQPWASHVMDQDANVAFDVDDGVNIDVKENAE